MSEVADREAFANMRDMPVMKHRLEVIEGQIRDYPTKFAKLEAATEQLPLIKKQLDEQATMIRDGFTAQQRNTNIQRGIFIGIAAFWWVFTYGAQLLKLVSANA